MFPFDPPDQKGTLGRKGLRKALDAYFASFLLFTPHINNSNNNNNNINNNNNNNKNK